MGEGMASDTDDFSCEMAALCQIMANCWTDNLDYNFTNPARQVWDLPNHMLNSHALINRMHVCVCHVTKLAEERSILDWLIKQGIQTASVCIVINITLWPGCVRGPTGNITFKAVITLGG